MCLPHKSSTPCSADSVGLRVSDFSSWAREVSSSGPGESRFTSMIRLVGVPTARSRNRSLLFTPNASSTSKNPLRSESQHPGFGFVTTIELEFMFSNHQSYLLRTRAPGRVRIFSLR
jgi:hypothetical protein